MYIIDSMHVCDMTVMNQHLEIIIFMVDSKSELEL